MRVVGYVAGVVLVVLSMATQAVAGSIAVPEIDAGSITGGLGLLAGGILLARARRGSK